MIDKATPLQPSAAIAERFTAAVAFFAEHAAASWDPAKETREEGIARQANELARAELAVLDNGWRFEWREDPDTDSSDWIIGQDHQPYTVWQCLMLGPDGRVLQSLGAIDFGRDGEPWGHPQCRVVQAELASVETNERIRRRSSAEHRCDGI